MFTAHLMAHHTLWGAGRHGVVYMGQGSNPNQKNMGFYGVDKRGVYIRHDLRNSDAYRVLTPTERLILIDMVSIFERLTKGGKIDIRDTGYCYTFGHCTEYVDESTFSRARTRILEVGFFECPPELQESRAGSANRYIPSHAWKKYQITEVEKSKLSRIERRKTQTIHRAKKRRIDFCSKLG